MAATIKIKNSSTASAVPTSSDLVQGELAVNVTDKRLFTENASGTVVELGTNPSSITLPAGSASAPTLLASGDTNTGIFFPAADTVGITTGGTERARVDSSGNMGVGVTPSAWHSYYKAVQVGDYAAVAQYVAVGGAIFSANAYAYGDNAWKYEESYYATRYQQSAGQHAWYTAASGTAGNAITFTQAMTLGADGNLGIGATSPSFALDISQAAPRIRQTAATGTNSSLIQLVNTGGTAYVGLDNSSGGLSTGYALNLYHSGAYPIVFTTNSAERARIDSSGNLLVGTTGLDNSNLTGIALQKYTNGGYITIAHTTGAGTGDGYVVFFRSNANIGSITQNGTTGVLYNTSSDYRLKEITGPVTGYKERLSALKPKQGSWKADGSEFRGFLAHEFAESYPSSVNGEKDAVDVDGNPKYQGMQAGSSEVIADLVAYINELETRLAALENK